MSRLECLEKSSTSSQKQLAVEVASVDADAETCKLNVTAEEKTVTDKPHRSLPAHALPHSVRVSCQESQRFGSVSGEVLKTEGCSPKESINTTPRVEEQAQSTVALDEELKRKYLRKAHSPDSAVTGETMHAPPPIEPLPTRGETNGEEEQTEVEDDGDEELKAPVELMIKFFRAVMDRDFQLASRLCQMILIYEPENPEASEFLPLIQKRLLEEQETEQSNNKDNDEDDNEDDDDDDDSDDSESDEESSASSSCSSSSSSSSSPSDDDDDDDEEEEEKQVNRHKLCPPSHVSP
ncbi:nuclear polyadenylated RNA-binding protein 3-like isoform X1 [Thunnus albacares]|uniref:nuclear polyadenylated RNA-binding protein 3-like isoform X1 n=1 Tax=Thunnus albacares TaxID=8236 RepID=UPI001CF69202|nr:nuclear polyadenylated RNA-binding protein 3-like isoform X1 [Thunnus albacares]